MTALDLRVPFTVCQEAFGLPATVRRPSPHNAPIQTDVVWLTPLTQEMPTGGSFGRRTSIRSMGISRADVPAVPRETRIEAAEIDGGPVKRWKVDEIELSEADHVRVIVVALESNA